MKFTRQQVEDVLGADVVKAAESLCRAFGKYLWLDMSIEEQKKYLAKVMLDRSFQKEDIETAFQNTISYGH